MKKALFVFIALLLASCSPTKSAEYLSLQATNQALLSELATLKAVTPTPLPTLTPTPRPTPTITFTPAHNYIMELGFCIMSVNATSITTDPDGIPGCGRNSREQLYLKSYEAATYTFHTMVSEVQYYCALFDMSRSLIMVNFDLTGSGKVTCHP